MTRARWSESRARQWYDALPWLVGCNFTPSTAANQLEMWQADTFDPETIERELGWAADLGFNTARVFLHDLAWTVDPVGFKDRLDRFLALASARGIRVMLVVFDDCWHPDPRPGPQPAPVPGVHNSRWLQSPGDRVARDPSQWGRLEEYVRDLLGSFGDDERVLVWDLYNEPGNTFLPTTSRPWPIKAFKLPALFLHHLVWPSPTLPLLRATFEWARAVGPTQPLTAGVWLKNRGLNRFQLGASDVISFHHYGKPKALERWIRKLSRHGRPLLCTEYLARSMASRFETHLPIFERERVGCYNWGLVAGKIQTEFSWLDRPGTEEPAVWFHDILRADGSPFDPREVETIKEHTARA